MPTPLDTVTVNSTHTFQTLISLVVPLRTVRTALPTLTVSLLAMSTPLPTNFTLSSLRFLTVNVLSLRAIRRIEAWVCFGVRADVDARAPLMMAGSPVGNVADAHYWGYVSW